MVGTRSESGLLRALGMVLSWLRQQEHLEPPGPEAASAYLSPLPDSQAQLLSCVCVWWRKGGLCYHYRGSPAFLGQLNSSRWLHWPQLVALFPLHGPTHDRAVVTVMAILFLFLPLESQNQRETSALLPCYREQGNGQAAEFGCSQPGPDRLRVTVSQRTGP